MIQEIYAYVRIFFTLFYNFHFQIENLLNIYNPLIN